MIFVIVCYGVYRSIHSECSMRVVNKSARIRTKSVYRSDDVDALIHVMQTHSPYVQPGRNRVSHVTTARFVC